MATMTAYLSMALFVVLLAVGAARDNRKRMREYERQSDAHAQWQAERDNQK